MMTVHELATKIEAAVRYHERYDVPIAEGEEHRRLRDLWLDMLDDTDRGKHARQAAYEAVEALSRMDADLVNEADAPDLYEGILTDGFDVTDDYTADLLEWLGSHREHVSLVEDVLDEEGWRGARERPFYSYVRQAQARRAESVAMHVCQVLVDAVEEPWNPYPEEVEA